MPWRRRIESITEFGTKVYVAPIHLDDAEDSDSVFIFDLSFSEGASQFVYAK